MLKLFFMFRTKQAGLLKGMRKGSVKRQMTQWNLLTQWTYLIFTKGYKYMYKEVKHKKTEYVH